MNATTLLKELKIPIVPSYSLNTIQKVLDLQSQKSSKEIIDGSLTPIKYLTVEDIANDTLEPSSFKTNKKDLKLKKGDVFTVCGTNGKRRPCVVAKVVSNGVYGIGLTTTEDEYTTVPHNSRFLQDGFFTNHFIYVNEILAKTRFLTVLDNNTSLNKAIKIIKSKIIKEIL